MIRVLIKHKLIDDIIDLLEGQYGISFEESDGEDDINIETREVDDTDDNSMQEAESRCEVMETDGDAHVDCTDEEYLEWRQVDDIEKDAVKQFLEKGCGCKRKCSSYFSQQQYEKMRNECTELTHSELDLVLMGEIMAFSSTKEVHTTSTFFHLARKVPNKNMNICKACILFKKPLGLQTNISFSPQDWEEKVPTH